MHSPSKASALMYLSDSSPPGTVPTAVWKLPPWNRMLFIQAPLPFRVSRITGRRVRVQIAQLDRGIVVVVVLAGAVRHQLQAGHELVGLLDRSEVVIDVHQLESDVAGWRSCSARGPPWPGRSHDAVPVRLGGRIADPSDVLVLGAVIPERRTSVHDDRVATICRCERAVDTVASWRKIQHEIGWITRCVTKHNRGIDTGSGCVVVAAVIFNTG